MVNYTETVNKAEAEYVMKLTKDDFYELFPRPLKSIKGSLEKTANNNEYHKMVLDYLAFHQKTNYEGMIVEYSPYPKIQMDGCLLKTQWHYKEYTAS